MFSILRDPILRERLATDGYVTLPWLDEAALQKVRELFAAVQPQVHFKGFATTTTSPDLALKQDMFAQVRELYAPLVEAHFQDYKLLGTSFLQKDSGQAGDLPLHQDWTVTDEDHYRTFTIWVPLEDCLEENGALRMLPGSHRFLNLLRGPNLPVAIRDIAPALEQHLVTLPLRAGEAVLFDHSLLHTSLRNTSGRPRIALTYGLTHRDTPLCFWYKHAGDAPDRFEQIAVPDDFFLRYHTIGQRPTLGHSLGYYRHDLRPVTDAEGQAMVAGQPLRRPIYRDLGDRTCLVREPQYAVTHKSGWNRDLAERGFVHFPLLDAAQVAHLRAFFEANQPTQVERFYASVHSPDTDFRLRMDAELQRILRPGLEMILADTEALGGSFIAKPRGSGGILPPHADWNIVDERRYRSYNLWIPLVDTTVANGAIHIIPGSHQWFDYFRGPGIPNPFEPLRDEIWKAMQALELPAGHALLYDHRLLHASPVNTTDTLRLACVVGVKPKAAAMWHYRKQDDIVQEYAAHPSYFMTQNPEESAGDLVHWADVTDQFPEVSLAELRGYQGIAEQEIAQTSTPPAAARSFWETYSPGNILREIRWRLTGRA